MADDVEGRPPKEQWHLDKKVPIALILAILVQTGGALVWAGAVASRIDALERSVSKTEDLVERVVKVEVQTQTIAKGVERIEDKLDKRP